MNKLAHSLTDTSNVWGLFKRNWLLLLATSIFLVVTLFQVFTAPLGAVPDEAYHYRAIQQHATQWSPVLDKQTDFTLTGDLTRNPSYLYHYLFSFPYRVLTHFNLSDQAKQNSIGIMTTLLGLLTIYILYTLLRRVTTKKIATQSVAVFALLPITSIVFAGPNYDNLLLPVIFLSLYLLVGLYKKFDMTMAILFISLLTIGSLIKFAYGPIALGAGLYFLFIIKKHFDEIKKYRLPSSLSKRLILAASCILLLGSLGLAVERYGGNMVRYYSPQPACERVQPRDKCLQYSVNNRNYYATIANKQKPRKDVVSYAVIDWFRNMVRGVVYPSPLLSLRFVIMGYVALGLFAVLLHKRTGYSPVTYAWLLLGISVFYTFVIFTENYRTLLKLGEPFAINGRYLLPIIPFLLVTSQANILVWKTKYPKAIVATGYTSLAFLMVANVKIVIG